VVFHLLLYNFQFRYIKSDIYIFHFHLSYILNNDDVIHYHHYNIFHIVHNIHNMYYFLHLNMYDLVYCHQNSNLIYLYLYTNNDKYMFHFHIFYNKNIFDLKQFLFLHNLHKFHNILHMYYLLHLNNNLDISHLHIDQFCYKRNDI